MSHKNISLLKQAVNAGEQEFKKVWENTAEQRQPFTAGYRFKVVKIMARIIFDHLLLIFICSEMLSAAAVVHQCRYENPSRRRVPANEGI